MTAPNVLASCNQVSVMIVKLSRMSSALVSHQPCVLATGVGGDEFGVAQPLRRILGMPLAAVQFVRMASTRQVE